MKRVIAGLCLLMSINVLAMDRACAPSHVDISDFIENKIHYNARSSHYGYLVSVVEKLELLTGLDVNAQAQVDKLKHKILSDALNDCNALLKDIEAKETSFETADRIKWGVVCSQERIQKKLLNYTKAEHESH